MSLALGALAACLDANAQRNMSPQDRSRADASVEDVQASHAHNRRVGALLMLYNISVRLGVDQRAAELRLADAYLHPPERGPEVGLPARILRGYGVEEPAPPACAHPSE